MQRGKVYRRSELARCSAAIDRDLKLLCDTGEVLKVGPGLYCRPKRSAFGPLPPDDKELVHSFLKDNRFLMTSFNHFNGLGLGLTQLYNHTLVYNFKRHESVQLGAKTFDFKRLPHFPKKLSKEFLLVDLLNNLKHLAEDETRVTDRLKEKIADFDPVALKKTAGQYGRARTRHLIEALYDSTQRLSS